MKKTFTRDLLALAMAGVSIVGCSDFPTTDHGEGGSGAGHQPFQMLMEISNVQLSGGETAAEISAYDPATKKLFVCNATKPGIDIIDMQDPNNLQIIGTISIQPYGGGVNSVAIHKGLLGGCH